MSKWKSRIQSAAKLQQAQYRRMSQTQDNRNNRTKQIHQFPNIIWMRQRFNFEIGFGRKTAFMGDEESSNGRRT